MVPWIPVVVTIALGLIGLAIQGALLAFFLGRMKSHQEGQEKLVAVFQGFTDRTLEALTTRMEKHETINSEFISQRATLDLRLANVERNTEGLAGLREALAGFRERYEAHRQTSEKQMDHVTRAVEAAQRQLATIANRGAAAPGVRHLDREIQAQGTQNQDG